MAATTGYVGGSTQLANSTDADEVATLYAYDVLYRLAYTAIDMDRNGTMDWSGTDRITWEDYNVVSDHGFSVLQNDIYAWTDNGSYASSLLSTSEQSIDGLQTWNTVWNSGMAVMSHSITVYAGSGNRYVTNIAPDNSYTVAAYQYGQLMSNTRYDASGSQTGQTTYGYDAFWRQNKVTDARNGTTTNWFNAMDQVSGISTPAPTNSQSAEVTTNYFDLLGRVVRTTLPDSTSVTNLYNLMGNVATNCGSRTYPVAYLYDSQGRMTNMTTWTNFPSGNAETTGWIYDVYRGWLVSKHDNNSQGPSYSYTPAGRLAIRTWARTTTTTYATNSAGDVATVKYSDSTPGVTNSYDRRGRLVGATCGPTVCALLLNDAGETLSESYTGGALDGILVSNVYDAILRRTNLSVFHSTTLLFRETNSFDAAGRLSNLSDGTNSAAYSYLANSPLVDHIIFAHSGAAVMTNQNAYDYLNRLTGKTTAQALLAFHYQYNNANQRASETNLDGSYWAYGYDSLGQVTSAQKHFLDHTPVAGQQFAYALDTIGNRTSTQAGGDASGANFRTASYTVNALNQITSRDVPGDVDVMGQVVGTNVVTVNGTNAYQKTDYYREQVATNNGTYAQWVGINVTAPGQTGASGHEFLAKTPETFGYDADGNLTNDGRWSYYWDGENRLVNMTSLSSGPAGSLLELAFVYDYKGRRVQKAVYAYSGTAYTNVYTNNFVYDGWNPVATLSGLSGLAASYVWGTDLSGSMQGAGGVGGLLAENVVSNGVHFVAYDGNGNVAALVSVTNGSTTASYEYGPFGEVIRATGPAAKLNPIRFSSKYDDDESDLLYYGYRYYNPSTGRWLSRDPMEEQGGPVSGIPIRGDGEEMRNLYAFVANDSVNQADFLGELGFTTSYGPTDLGDCGGGVWRRKWSLGPQEITGYIIQQITMSDLIYNCAGVPMTPPTIYKVYWEAFPISGGKGTINDTDTFVTPRGGAGTYGNEYIQGVARFYWIGTLPPGFSTTAVKESGGLPATTTQPALWTATGSWAGTTTVTGTLSVNWSCCCKNAWKTTFVRGTPLSQ